MRLAFQNPLLKTRSFFPLAVVTQMYFSPSRTSTNASIGNLLIKRIHPQHGTDCRPTYPQLIGPITLWEDNRPD